MKLKNTRRPHSPADDVILQAMFVAGEPVSEMAETLDRTPVQVELALKRLGLISEMQPHLPEASIDYLGCNYRFSRAMHAAVKAGAECPPMIGVDVRHSTERPQYRPVRFNHA